MPASSSKTGSRSRHRGDLEEEYGSAKVIFLSVRLKSHGQCCLSYFF